MMNNSDAFLSAVFAEFDPKGQTLVMGIIGRDGKYFFTEGLWKIESEKDLPPMFPLKMRSRLNAHREMQMFYFRTNDFEKIKRASLRDNKKFSKWVHECKKIKRESLH